MRTLHLNKEMWKMIQEDIKAYTGSIRELARIAGVSHSAIINIRDGKRKNPGVLTVEKIASAIKQLSEQKQGAA